MHEKTAARFCDQKTLRTKPVLWKTMNQERQRNSEDLQLLLSNHVTCMFNQAIGSGDYEFSVKVFNLGSIWDSNG